MITPWSPLSTMLTEVDYVKDHERSKLWATVDKWITFLKSVNTVAWAAFSAL